MSRTKGYKCFNIKCGSCIGKTLCGEPEDTALVCVDRVIGKPVTNADRIRAMTDDELVNWIADINPFYCQTCVYAKPCRLEYDVETVNYAEKYDCKDGILQWLQHPEEDGTT